LRIGISQVRPTSFEPTPCALDGALWQPEKAWIVRFRLLHRNAVADGHELQEYQNELAAGIEPEPISPADQPGGTKSSHLDIAELCGAVSAAAAFTSRKRWPVSLRVRCSLLPEVMIERHHKRPDSIVERSTLDRRDHHRGRHAGVEADVWHCGQLILIDADEGRVIGIVGLLVRQPVGGNLNDGRRE